MNEYMNALFENGLEIIIKMPVNDHCLVEKKLCLAKSF